MEQKRLEQLLSSMGISYTHTATKPTAQLHPSQGRYSTTGDWIETEFNPQVEMTGVKVTDIPSDPGVCEYCDLVVDKPPVIHLQCKVNRFKTTDWKIKCQNCKKVIEYKDFKQSLDSSDK